MDKKTLIVAAVGVVLIGVFAALFFMKNSEMEEMVEVFTEERQTLIDEYQDLSLDFDSLRSNNDELNMKLELERERIAQLMEELNTVKATDARRIKELQNELNSTRAIMRSFVHQIDSLNQINVKLTKENKDMRSQVAQVRNSYNQLAKENEALNEQVEIASRLEAQSVSVQCLNFKEKKTSSASKTSKIKVSFTILKNITAQVGMRTVYLRITRPDGQLLLHSKDDTFDFDNTQINFSASRDVEYGGDELSTYVVYTVDSGELMSGAYEVEIFCGGERIGSGSFTLKN